MFISQRLNFWSMFTKAFLLSMVCTIYHINMVEYEWFFEHSVYIRTHIVLFELSLRQFRFVRFERISDSRLCLCFESRCRYSLIVILLYFTVIKINAITKLYYSLVTFNDTRARYFILSYILTQEQKRLCTYVW